MYIPFVDDASTKMRFYFEKDKTLGYDIRSNFRDGDIVFLDGTHAVFSNSFGCFDAEDEVPERYILLVGDSFTWGFAPYEKKWGTILQSLLEYRVVKCGVKGSGTKYQVLKARKVIDLIGHAPKLIVVGYYGNDFGDDIVFGTRGVVNGYVFSTIKRINVSTGDIVRYSKTELEARYERFLSKEFDPKSWIRDHSVIANLLWRVIKGGAFQTVLEDVQHIEDLDLHRMRLSGVGWVEDEWQRHLQNVLDVRRLAQEVGAELVFVLVPHKGGFDLEHIERFLRESKIRYIDVYEKAVETMGRQHFSDLYWPYDSHWNLFGNEFVAVTTAKFLLENQLLENVPTHVLRELERRAEEIQRTHPK